MAASRRRRCAAAIGAAALAGALAWRAAAHAASLAVDATRGRLTVAVEGAPLEAVLDAVGAETGVAVTVHGAIAREVSDRFRGLSVEAGLRRLLRPFNVAFVYGPSRGPAPARLERVVVYPPGTPSRAPEIERLLAHADPLVRRRALEVAEATGLASAESLRVAALTDPDLQVRWAALAALVATAGREAAVQAAESALGSGSAPERLAALEALGEQIGGEAGERAAQRALADPDPAVRAKAAEIVAILEEDQRLANEGEEAAEADEAETPAETPVGAAPR